MSLVVTGAMALAGECSIITSPLDFSTMRFGYSSWYSQTRPVVEVKTMKVTNFVDAYSEFDELFTQNIKDVVCTKNKWDGVANYKITWQRTENGYIFVGTFDAFAYK